MGSAIAMSPRGVLTDVQRVKSLRINLRGLGKAVRGFRLRWICIDIFFLHTDVCIDIEGLSDVLPWQLEPLKQRQTVASHSRCMHGNIRERRKGSYKIVSECVSECSVLT